MPDSDAYQPIACSFYDELGLRMMREHSCTFVIDEGDQEETIDAAIDDVFTEGDAEYVRLDNDRCIRLDHIRRVDDVTRAAC
jgi:transcriptional antiterminator Rof (Rho-off)